jgi:hypothetical protein
VTTSGAERSQPVRELCANRHSAANVGRILLSVALAASLLGCPSANDNSPIASILPTVQVFETTGDRTQLLQAQTPITFMEGGSAPGVTITVDSGKQYQTMDGFGASFSDSSAWLIWNKLNSMQQKLLLQQLRMGSD